MDIIIELSGSKPYKIVPSQLTPKKFHFCKSQNNKVRSRKPSLVSNKSVKLEISDVLRGIRVR